MNSPSISRPYTRRVLAALGRDPERIVLRRPGTAVTAAGLRASVLGCAALLRAHGAGPGTTVAILTGPNHPSMLSARYAAHLLGATSVYIRSMNPRTDTETFTLSTQAEVLAALDVPLLARGRHRRGQRGPRQVAVAAPPGAHRPGDPPPGGRRL